MPTVAAKPAVNEQKLHEFLGKVVTDFGAALSCGLAYIGQRLGLYKAMADGEPVTPGELSQRTGTAERYVREWLINQAASGYVDYDPAEQKYRLLPEQAMALTDEESPAFVGGGFYVIKAMMQAPARIAEAFQTGEGMAWGEHDADLFLGTEKFFRPGYTAHLVKEWIPALTGRQAKLERGALVADVGCGHGASTLIMAQAFPKSHFIGIDSHEGSVQRARRKAEEAGISHRVQFTLGDATRFPGQNYDLICFFDCFHDMADPLGAARRAYETLAAEGSVLIVEPMAGDRVEENFNPIGRTFSAASTLCCTPNGLTAKTGPALGAVATESAIRGLFEEAGFRSFRRAAQTPFNRIFEARKA